MRLKYNNEDEADPEESHVLEQDGIFMSKTLVFTKRERNDVYSLKVLAAKAFMKKKENKAL